MSYSIEPVVESVTLGEGPHWDAGTQCLYFVDILSRTIHRYKPSQNQHTKATLDQSASFIIPIKGADDKFVIGLEQHLAVITWDGVSNTVSNVEKVAEIDSVEDPRGIRLNDAKVDYTGKLWTGSFVIATALNDFPSLGKLYSFNKDLRLKSHLEGVRLSNGLAWNERLGKFYYIDSLKRTIDEFDYDHVSESIGGRKSIFSLDKHKIDGLPDGQTIDTDGNLWVAVFTGSKIIKINPRIPETLLQTIDMPAKQVTSVAFGGKNLDELYVTTGKVMYDRTDTLTPADGVTYRIRGLGVKGFAGAPFVIGK